MQEKSKNIIKKFVYFLLAPLFIVGFTNTTTQAISGNPEIGFAVHFWSFVLTSTIFISLFKFLSTRHERSI